MSEIIVELLVLTMNVYLASLEDLGRGERTFQNIVSLGYRVLVVIRNSIYSVCVGT